jgi:homogentisate 1,2-dioxygenase
MPIYRRLGKVPPKRHTAFRKPDGSLYPEELIGSHGFSGPSSLLYHLRRPTTAESVKLFRALTWEADPDATVTPRHFRSSALSTGPSAVLDRVPLLYNRDVALSMAKPQRDDDFFYRNGQADEMVYVSQGEGVLESLMGDLPFRQGDYLIIPRGILHRYRLGTGPHAFLVLESAGSIRVPKRYRNDFGQLLEISPFGERDLRGPEQLVTRDQKGAFRVLAKRNDALTELVLDHHPFDLVGWDGYYYPWAFNIRDFEPRVGRIHLPPPVHQTFEGDGFVVCSFCPRPFDFDPEAVPAPYNHSNAMSEEVIFYANNEFMSRKGIEFGSITLHPDGIPHGPHPGRAEASIGKKWTDELAVMVDTFRPLHVAKTALPLEDKDYSRSWLDEGGPG